MKARIMKSFIEQNSNRSPLKDLLPLNQPLSLCIEPTALCNFKCSFCARSHPDFLQFAKIPRIMSIKLFDKIIKDINTAGWAPLQKLNLYGDGEPFLHQQLFKMIRKSIQIAYPVVVTTNGSLFSTTTDMKNIVESGLHYLRVSIYGIDKIRHTKNTGQSRITSQQIRENVIRLREYRDQQGVETPYIYVKMIDQGDQEENKAFFEAYEGIADQINLESPMNWNSFDNVDLISELNPDADECTIQNFYTDGGKQIKGKRACTIPFHSMNIKSNGDVVACIVDWNRGTCIGNVTKQSLKEIWNGDKIKELRRDHLDYGGIHNVSCKNCKNRFANPESIDNLPREKFNGMI